MRVPEARLVDLGLVLDVSSSVGILESIQRLLEVAVSNGHACNHQSAAVATQGILHMHGLGLMYRVCVGCPVGCPVSNGQARDHEGAAVALGDPMHIRLRVHV